MIAAARGRAVRPAWAVVARSAVRPSWGGFGGVLWVVAWYTVVYVAIAAAPAQKIGFFGRSCVAVGVWSGSVLPVPFWGGFGACLGCPCLLSLRDKYPTPIFGGLFGGRCYPTLSREKNFVKVKKGVVDKGAKKDFFVKRG